MKKKAVLSVLLIVMMFLLCACGMKNVNDVNETKNLGNRFKQYSEEYSGMIVVDAETNVMYWLSTGAYNSGTLTLLVDHNGNPKIYHGGNAE